MRLGCVLGLALVASGGAVSAGAENPSVPEHIAPMAGVTVPTSFEPWTMTASTRSDLLHEWMTRGPCQTLACTDWILEPKFAIWQVGPECAIRDVSVKVSVIYHLPIWQPARPVPDGARAWWRRTLPDVLAHEGGHRDRAVATGNRLREALAALPPGPTCAELTLRGKAVARRVIEEGERGQRQYDRETDGIVRTLSEGW